MTVAWWDAAGAVDPVDADLVAGVVDLHRGAELLGRAHLGAVDRDDRVTGTDAGVVGRAPRLRLGDDRTGVWAELRARRRDVPAVPGEPGFRLGLVAGLLRRLHAPRGRAGDRDRPGTAPPAPLRRARRSTAATGSAAKATRDGSAPPVKDGETAAPLRGSAARVVENMEASLQVPTATSVRTVAAKLLEVNRQILNNHLNRVGHGKVSFTHLIAYAIAKAVQKIPAMNSGYGVVDGKPMVVHHEHLNLGPRGRRRAPDGSRSLLVPNVKHADELDFAGFFAAYEELIRKVRTNKLAPDDFVGTTGTITNPGMIGTVHSVPRLMPGQGFIIGVGTIAYPAEYEGADPQTVARLAVSKMFTLTSTYDHRIIGGAESGEFLRWMHQLLLGDDDFYDEIFQSFGVPYEPARWSTDVSPLDDPSTAFEKVVSVHQLVNMYRCAVT